MDILNTICQRLESISAEKGHAILAIDGRACSGKTTIAACMSEKLSAPVIHMDDFFLPPELRTTERYSQPGGNIHYERFIAEVLPSLYTHQSFSYRKFDCSILDYSGSISIPESPIVIVEGSYSLHPAIDLACNVSVFLDISDECQRQRILRRNGAKAMKSFENIWIPLENRYFSAFGIRERSEHVIDGGVLEIEL